MDRRKCNECRRDIAEWTTGVVSQPDGRLTCSACDAAGRIERGRANQRSSDLARLAELDAALFERDRLREALAPFAAVKIERRAPDGDDACGWIVDDTWGLKVEDFRRAKNVFEASSGRGGDSDVLTAIGVAERAG